MRDQSKLVDGSTRGTLNPAEIEICKRPDGTEWLLGSGSFSRVYKGLRRGVQEVAVKKLVCTIDADAQLRLLRKEINVLEKVSFDRNIVQYYGACLQDQATAMLVMEYMSVRPRPLCLAFAFSLFCGRCLQCLSPQRACPRRGGWGLQKADGACRRGIQIVSHRWQRSGL